MKRLELGGWLFLMCGIFVALARPRSAPVILLGFAALVTYVMFRTKLSAQKPALPDSNEFRVDDGTDPLSDDSIELDSDMNYLPSLNHFYYRHRYETIHGNEEYEYRVEGLKVEVRLLHKNHQESGMEQFWDVRDGVLLETDFRERSSKNRFYSEKIEERVSYLKKALVWTDILPTHWNGVKYFILDKKMPKPDSRRFFRQEIERLKSGSISFIREAQKIGFISDETQPFRLRLPEGVEPPEEERQKLSDSITAFGISYHEFHKAPKLVMDLEKYLASERTF
jgi:hypothetical protein